MRELTEQEKEFVAVRFDAYWNNKSGIFASDIVSTFRAGFAAGLDYAEKQQADLQAENERLRAALEALVADYDDYAYLPPNDNYTIAKTVLAGAAQPEDEGGSDEN